ncbi:DMT family transporter [Streptomyces sp. NPDC015220]|uniref:DMT family transporter n=1 Tax=Streptomyces sp. NPDC015220 TaxID=3364947 RepID=UPI0036FF8A7A
MSALALSVLLSLVSAVAYAGGAIVQERVAVSSPGERYAPLRRPVWWAAVALNGLGGLLHVVALAYGPLSLVQPLGALTIVFALPMAALFVGRRAGAAAWRGAIMATVGLAGLLSLVGASHAQTLSAAQRVTLAVVTGGALVALTVAGRAAHRHPAVRSVLLAVGSGLAFGMSSVFTKTVAVDWTDGVAAAELPSLAAIGVLATAGMLLSQASYRGGGLAAPLATLTVVNPVAAAAVGITMFGETFRYGTTGTVLALACGVLAVGGLILLTTERLERTAPAARSAAAPAPSSPSDDAGAGPAPFDGPSSTDTDAAAPAPLEEPASGPEGPEGAARSEEPPPSGPAGAEPAVLDPAAVRTAVDAPPRETLAVRIPSQPDAPPDDVLVTAGPAPEEAAAAGSGRDREESPLAPEAYPGGTFLAVPFHRGPYVRMPVLDRHRARVRS